MRKKVPGSASGRLSTMPREPGDLLSHPTCDETSEEAMGADASTVAGPDFAAGIDAAQLSEGGSIEGHVGDEAVLLARSGGQAFAVGAKCTHYGASLAVGLVHDGTVRCPWHHACFSLRTGEAAGPPAFDPLARWSVEERDGRIVVSRKLAPKTTMRAAGSDAP